MKHPLRNACVNKQKEYEIETKATENQTRARARNTQIRTDTGGLDPEYLGRRAAMDTIEMRRIQAFEFLGEFDAIH
jgi:hypothetical protein